MVRRLLCGLVVIGLALAAGGGALAQETDDTLRAALDFLRAVQNEDGGFSNGFAPESDLGATADAVVALVAAGEDVTGVTAGDEQAPLDSLNAQLEAGVAEGNGGQIAKVITALVAAGEDPADFNGRDLVGELLALQGEDGLFGLGAFDHCLSVIALQNAGEPLPDGTLDALLAAQNEDGGWGFMAEQASDTNTTGLCVQALALEDGGDAASSGLDYLADIQNEDGGWPYQNPSEFGTASDTSSTAIVLQALVAHEVDMAEWIDPVGFLTGLQEDSGAFRYQDEMPGDNILATVSAIPALAGVPLNEWAPEPVAE